MKIKVTQTSNSTPNRNLDYQAVLEDYEGGDFIGHGNSPIAAKHNLLSQMDIEPLKFEPASADLEDWLCADERKHRG